jgi:hypothetical protein
MARHPARTINPTDDPLNAGKALAEIPDDLRELYAQPVPQDFLNEEDEVNAVLAEAGGGQGGGSVVIRKMNTLTRKFEWLARHPAAEFLSMGGVAYLASKYGGGEYELLVYGADNRILKRPKVTVAASVVAEVKQQESAQLSGVDKLAAAMLEGFKTLQAQIQQVQRPPESRETFIRELMMMKELFGGGNNRGTELDSLIKVMPIVRDMMPRGEGETNALDVFMRLAQEFAPAIREAVAKTPALSAPKPQAGAPQVGAQILSPEQQGANQMQLMLRAKLAMLCNEAKADSDPGPYAAIVVEKVSPEMLATLVNNPEWLDELGKIHPSVKLFPKWFGELRDAVIEIMTEPEDLTDDLETGTRQGIENLGIPGAHVPESTGNDSDT